MFVTLNLFSKKATIEGERLKPRSVENPKTRGNSSNRRKKHLGGTGC